MKISVRAVVGGMLMGVLVGTVAITPDGAVAHEGHAGKMETFVSTGDALRAMLPSGSRITKRKEVLSDAAAERARQQWGAMPKPGVHQYFLARDRVSGDVVGMATVWKGAYQHGEVELAVGIDTAGQITQAAVLGIHGKYVKELKRSLGKGFLPGLAGGTIDAVSTAFHDAAEDDRAAKAVLAQLRDMVAVLHALRPSGPVARTAEERKQR